MKKNRGNKRKTGKNTEKHAIMTIEQFAQKPQKHYITLWLLALNPNEC